MRVCFRIAGTLKKISLSLGLLLSLAGMFQVTAQTNPSTSNNSAQPQAQAQAQIDSLIQQQRELIQRVDKKDAELAELRIKLETTTSNLTFFAGFLGILLTIGTGFSIYGFIRSEKRATEAHSFSLSNARDSEQRAGQAFGLALLGETANQKRAAEVHENFLSGSKETLELGTLP